MVATLKSYVIVTELALYAARVVPRNRLVGVDVVVVLRLAVVDGVLELLLGQLLGSLNT